MSSDRDSKDYETSSFLSVRGADIVPSEVSRALKVLPTGSSDRPAKRGAKRTSNAKFWRFQTKASSSIECRSVEDAIRAIIDAPEIDLSRFAELPKDWERAITVTVFSDERPCIALSAGLMNRLGEARIGVEMSIYAGEDSSTNSDDQADIDTD